MRLFDFSYRIPVVKYPVRTQPVLYPEFEIKSGSQILIEQKINNKYVMRSKE